MVRVLLPLLVLPVLVVVLLVVWLVLALLVLLLVLLLVPLFLSVAMLLLMVSLRVLLVLALRGRGDEEALRRLTSRLEVRTSTWTHSPSHLSPSPRRLRRRRMCSRGARGSSRSFGLARPRGRQRESGSSGCAAPRPCDAGRVGPAWCCS